MIIGFLKERQRKRLKARPFPNEWLKMIKSGVAFFVRLSAADQAELLDHIQVFIAEKRFEGCAGLEINDEILVTIAARLVFFCCAGKRITFRGCSRFSFIHRPIW